MLAVLCHNLGRLTSPTDQLIKLRGLGHREAAPDFGGRSARSLRAPHSQLVAASPAVALTETRAASPTSPIRPAVPQFSQTK